MKSIRPSRHRWSYAYSLSPLRRRCETPYDARDRQSGVVKGTASASYTYYPTGLRKTKLAGGANTTFVLPEVPPFFKSCSRCAFFIKTPV